MSVDISSVYIAFKDSVLLPLSPLGIMEMKLKFLKKKSAKKWKIMSQAAQAHIFLIKNRHSVYLHADKP